MKVKGQRDVHKKEKRGLTKKMGMMMDAISIGHILYITVAGHTNKYVLEHKYKIKYLTPTLDNSETERRMQ